MQRESRFHLDIAFMIFEYFTIFGRFDFNVKIIP